MILDFSTQHNCKNPRWTTCSKIRHWDESPSVLKEWVRSQSCGRPGWSRTVSWVWRVLLNSLEHNDYLRPVKTEMQDVEMRGQCPALRGTGSWCFHFYKGERGEIRGVATFPYYTTFLQLYVNYSMQFYNIVGQLLPNIFGIIIKSLY